MLNIITKLKNNISDKQYRYSVALLLLAEALLLTTTKSYYLTYSIPLPMYNYVSLLFYGDYLFLEFYELSLYFGYISTIIIALLLYWWFALEVVLNRKNVIAKKYYIGLAILMGNIVIMYLVADVLDETINYGVDSSSVYGMTETSISQKSLAQAFFFDYLNQLLPVFVVYIHFTIISLLRRKNAGEKHPQ